MKNSVKKTKFIDTTNIEYNKQPFYHIDPNYNSQINLLKDNYNYKEKNINENEIFFDYKPLLNLEPGRGFGNLNVNNEIRNGKSSRSDIEDFKLNRESDLTNRFNIIDTRYLNSYNTILPFPISGRTLNN